MKTLGNIIWHIPFLGFVNAIVVFLVGILFAITIVGLPIARGLFEFAKFLMFPFDYNLVNSKNTPAVSSVWNGIMSVIWIVFFGIWLWIWSVFQIISMFMSIVGIPVAIVMAKSLGTFFNPVGKVCVKIN